MPLMSQYILADANEVQALWQWHQRHISVASAASKTLAVRYVLQQTMHVGAHPWCPSIAVALQALWMPLMPLMPKRLQFVTGDTATDGCTGIPLTGANRCSIASIGAHRYIRLLWTPATCYGRTGIPLTSANRCSIASIGAHRWFSSISLPSFVGQVCCGHRCPSGRLRHRDVEDDTSLMKPKRQKPVRCLIKYGL
jgi:hypothetical protein